ncbi:UNVERIFIED_ORG: aryl-alcohol dehydrogenase-like predicted oxidoreductase [Pseudomonas parafulva]|uniref:aldo/keto reductase n=1 Tax=Pseudomonas TaxID=286 RepID=UPI0019D129C9|nr:MULTISPECIES: aldo/keto reductase [Pseudomonas]MDP9555154.1 aryl-alcohol dehydrogenase-like predicted oxidoreductase [Pseudomonas parafulva]MBN6790443.1 aldo/keto reductase [Pseudomonas fulva]MBN6795251.1 aldo/keto reductase [Pseudomonas fulva]MBN6855911.1 aldo/keto reductase [Pseudomonas fulva]MBN6873435.1 aldo/keto reductase [Pseudomonas fulva]
MQYVKLGTTGLDISRLCLGCMTFGEPDAGTHPWTLGEGASRPIIRHAVEQGINFFDTANSYSAGTSEVILGKLLKEFTRRDETVIATKVFYPANMWQGASRPNEQGLSRKAIMTSIDASLSRLGTDYVDLYQIHRWDYTTPIEETMEALNDVVRAGKARYIGASSMYAWQFAKAQQVAASNGWSRFVSMQNFLNLLYREEEREMIPLCLDQGVGLMPWSPMARGRLTRPNGQQTERTRTDLSGQSFFENSEEQDGRVIDVVEQIAQGRGVPMAQVALAWVLGKQGVSSPIVGASKPAHLDDALAAIDLHLTAEETARLEAPYVPHAVTGFK